jgi:curved DNA-binding protein CbpA
VSPETSLYDLLGIRPQSDPSEIRAAYYAAIRTCHPDVDASPGAPELALKIIAAYRVLGDPERRKQYNARLRLDASLFGDADVPPAAPSACEAGRHEPKTPSASTAPAAAVEHAEPEAEITPGERPRAKPDAAGNKRDRRGGWLRAAAAGLSFAAGFALLVLVVSGLRSPAGRGIAATAAAQQPDAFVQTAAAPNAPASPCLDLFSGLKGEKLYRECVKTRVKLHLRMMRLASGAEMEQDELQDAMAEIRQAVGAAQVHMASTQGFIEESVATFADVKERAKDEQVRRIAENYYYYYDCQALKHCAQ